MGIVRGERITNPDNPMKKPTSSTKEVKTKAEVIKLGIDVHIDRYVVVMMVDGGTPKAPRRFSPPSFLKWIEQQVVKEAQQIVSCYEAGPFGYSLHRQLKQLGVQNYVIRPRDWDEYGKKVKTDKRDAHQMALCLDRYVNGNREAFSVVYVPSEEQERKRSVSRQRQSMMRQRQRLAAQGRSQVMYYGGRLRGPWWNRRKWERCRAQLPPTVCELLEPLRRIILAIDEELKNLTKKIEAEAPEGLPTGLGKMTCILLEREVGNWQRFKNRRQIGSYTGLCPSEDSSNQRRFQGPINKHGNRRLRHLLIECVWRLLVYQPDYYAIKKWERHLCDLKLTKARKKKIIVALARQFAVDWWRIQTGRLEAKALGLQLNPINP